jgi:hypothetical protein
MRPAFDGGYANFWLNGTNAHAHRISWVMANGEIPDGLVVRHSCDVKHCVNPAHLSIGTQADNMADKVSRKRQARGAAHGRSKLSSVQVEAIREMRSQGILLKDIAAAYDISVGHVGNITTNPRYWNHEGSA